MIVKNPWKSPVFHYSELDSTMNKARLLIKEGIPHGTALLCNHQSKGRGRGPGRTWHTKPGDAMLASIILDAARVPVEPAASLYSAHVCSRVISGCLSDLIPQRTDDIEIKWPNDLMLNGRKLGGILCEMVGRQWLIIGIGINISSAPDYNQDDTLRRELRWPVTCLADAGISISPEIMLQNILFSFLEGEAESSAHIVNSINSKLYCRGCKATAVFPDGSSSSGVLTGIDNMGAALLETGEGINRISNADLSYLS